MSNEKKLFPGVTPKEIAERERLAKLAEESAKAKAEEQRKQREISEQQKREANERNDAYNKYAHIKPIKTMPSKGSSVISVIASLTILWGCCAWMGFFTEGPSTEWNPQTKSREPVKTFKKIKQRLRDNVWPISNGWYVANEGDPEEPDTVYRYSDKAKGKFLPRGIWYMNMAFLLVAICGVIKTLKKHNKEIAQIREYNASAISHNKTSKATVDMMLELKKFGQQYNLNTDQVKKLVESATEIISRMSGDERVYFDMLLNGDLDNTSDKETFMKMATAIMSGHLQTHPEDMKLVMEVYDAKSIPEEIIQKYSQYQK